MRAARGLERTSEHVVTTVTEMRRRLDIHLLRWQARIDAPAVDRSLPWVVATILGLTLILLALARHQDLGVGAQLGHYLQAVHLMAVGRPPVVSELGVDVFAIQASWLFWPVSWLARVFPPAETMLTVQSVALALGVVPLWRIARGPANLRSGAAGALVVAYALHPSIHNLNLSGFHPEALALPALMGAYLAGHRGRWWILAVLVAVVVAARADLGLAVFALGLVLVTEDRRRPGWLTAGFGVTWFLVMAFGVQPALGDGSYPHLMAFADFGDSVDDVLFGMLADPAGLAGDLLARASFEKLLLLVGPVLFLPLVRPRYLIPLFPLMALYLIADVPDDGFGNPHQDVAAVVLVFVAATWALMRIGTSGFSRVMVDRRVLAVLVLTAAVFFVRDAAPSPYEEPWAWGRRDAVDLARVASTGWVGDQARVLAAPALYPLLAERETAYVLHLGEPTTPDATMVAGVDVLVFDGNDLNWARSQIRDFEDGMVELGFGRRYESEGIQVWIRRPGSG